MQIDICETRFSRINKQLIIPYLPVQISDDFLQQCRNFLDMSYDSLPQTIPLPTLMKKEILHYPP